MTIYDFDLLTPYALAFSSDFFVTLGIELLCLGVLGVIPVIIRYLLRKG